MQHIYYLAKLVKMNYKLRALKLLPDKWYWADKLLLAEGFYINWDYRLEHV